MDVSKITTSVGKGSKIAKSSILKHPLSKKAFFTPKVV